MWCPRHDLAGYFAKRPCRAGFSKKYAACLDFSIAKVGFLTAGYEHTFAILALTRLEPNGRYGSILLKKAAVATQGDQ